MWRLLPLIFCYTANQYSEITRFFLRFENKECILRINKSEILVKTLLMETTLRLQVSMNKVKTKELCFGYFCRFVTSALTIRQRNTYIYVFRVLFGFSIFLSHFQSVFEAKKKLTLFYTKFLVNRVRFVASISTSFLLRSKPVQ